MAKKERKGETPATLRRRRRRGLGALSRFPEGARKGKRRRISPPRTEEQDTRQLPTRRRRPTRCRQGKPVSGGGRDWSGLPGLALLSILERMARGGRLADLRALSGVCRPWRLASEPRELCLAPCLPPLLVAYAGPERDDPDPSLGVYSLPDGRFHRRKSLQVPPVLLCGDVRIVGCSRGYMLVTWPGVDRFAWHGTFGYYHRLFLVDPLADGAEASAHVQLPVAPLPITSALLTASPAPSTGREPGDCLVVALDSEGIQTCRPGDATWRVFKYSPLGPGGSRAVSIGEKVYVLLHTGNVLVFQFFPGLMSRRMLEVKGLGHLESAAFNTSFLAELDGEVLLVLREEKIPREGSGRIAADVPPGEECWCCKEHEYLRESHRYVLYRLDLSARAWVRLESLGDHALFLNPSRTGGNLVCDAARWGGSNNCIYRFCKSSGKVSIFRMESRTVEHVPFPLAPEHDPAIPFHPKPPHGVSWIWIRPTASFWR